MAISSAEKRGRLEDAWALSGGKNPPSSLRIQLRALEQAARTLISGGAITHTSGNGQSVEFAPYGPGQITPFEIVELYRWLVDNFDDSFNFLSQCAKYGLDPFQVEQTFFPSVTILSAQANLIDLSGRFLLLCAQFGLNPTDIIGKQIGDAAVFLWMMYYTVAITESQGDYCDLRVSSGGQVF